MLLLLLPLLLCVSGTCTCFIMCMHLALLPLTHLLPPALSAVSAGRSSCPA
jgi:hypothetical protein